MSVLYDTNMLLLHVAGVQPLELEPGEAAISVLSVFEALRLPGLSSEEESALKELISVCEILPVTESTGRKAALIGRTKRGKGIDLLIAATAIEHGMDLVTMNKKDFRGIPKLTVR